MHTTRTGALETVEVQAANASDQRSNHKTPGKPAM